MQIGVIFDFDGVVIDSSAAHETSWERLAVEEQRDLPEGHFKKGFGRKNAYIIPEILGWTDDGGCRETTRLGRRKEALYREVLKEAGLVAMAGVESLLKELKSAGIPCAIGSSTERENIETALGLTGLTDYFTVIVSADDVSKGKPDPEVFLKAVQRIEREPTACVVFEDAHVGLEAAKAGGMKSVGVATTHPIDTLTGADFRIRSLAEINIHMVRGLFV